MLHGTLAEAFLSPHGLTSPRRPDTWGTCVFLALTPAFLGPLAIPTLVLDLPGRHSRWHMTLLPLNLIRPSDVSESLVRAPFDRPICPNGACKGSVG